MNTSKFKYVVGEAKENEVCDIRLFCDIDEYTANSFNSEFLWVESYIKPSKIRVLINSSGGSVLYGMSASIDCIFICFSFGKTYIY